MIKLINLSALSSLFNIRNYVEYVTPIELEKRKAKVKYKKKGTSFTRGKKSLSQKCRSNRRKAKAKAA